VSEGLNCRRVTSKDKSGYMSEETKKLLSESKLRNPGKKAIPVLNTKTGQTFKSIRQASKTTDYSITKLKKSLSGLSQNTTDFKYVDEKLQQKTTYLPRNTKLVLDTETGVFYESFKELADTLMLDYSYVKSKLIPSCKYKTTFKKYKVV
jgi:hypothetical protein